MRINRTVLSLMFLAVVLAAGHSLASQTSGPAIHTPCADLGLQAVAPTDEAPCPSANGILALGANPNSDSEPQNQAVVPTETYSWLAADAEAVIEATNEVACSEPVVAARPEKPPLLCFDSEGCEVYCCAKRGVIKKIQRCCGDGRLDCQSLCK